MRRAAIIGVTVAGLLPGCDETFQSKGIFEPKLVVYSTLTPGSDSVFVRVHTTYDPPSFNPLEHTTETPLTGATVVFASDTSSMTLRDTTVAHPDPSRYGPTMQMFYGTPANVGRGRRYTLDVTAPGYPRATASVTMPGIQDIRILNVGLLSSPRSFDTQDIVLILFPPREAKGFLPRFFIEYELQLPSPHRERMEVPVDVAGSQASISPVYPQLTPIEGFGPQQFETASSYHFKGYAYQYAIDKIKTTHGAANVQFRQVIFYVYLAEEHLYNYYHVVNGFFDEFTIRTDLPDYSNVQGGIGLFGAYSVDSVNVPLPSVLN